MTKCKHVPKPEIHLGYLKGLVEKAILEISPDALMWPSITVDPWTYACEKCGKLLDPILWQEVPFLAKDRISAIKFTYKNDKYEEVE